MNPKYLTLIGLVGLFVYQSVNKQFSEAVNTLLAAAAVLGWVQDVKKGNDRMADLEETQHKIKLHLMGPKVVKGVDLSEFEEWKAKQQRTGDEPV